MMQAKNILRVVSSIVFFLFVHQAWATTEWIYFASNSARDSYYDKDSIIRVDKNVVRVRTKQVLSENGKVKILSHFRNQGQTKSKLDLISFIVKVSDLDCANRKIKDTSTIFYDERSDLLYSSPTHEAGNWDEIIPNSLADKLSNIFCGKSFVGKDDAIVAAGTDESITQVNSAHKAAPGNQIAEEEIKILINRWLASWQSGDMKTYRSCYDDNFKSKKMKLNEWIQYKTNVRNKSGEITIAVDDLKILSDGKNVRAEFIQTYNSSILKDKGKKTLNLKKVGNAWKISAETMQ